MSATSGAVVLAEPVGTLESLAALVRELVAGGAATLHNPGGLQTHALEAGLDADMRAALEALRGKLCQNATLLTDDGIASWN